MPRSVPWLPPRRGHNVPFPGREDGQWPDRHRCRFAAGSPRLPRSCARVRKNAPPGMEMAARLLQPEGFAMTARIIVPLLPDLMTLPELMAEVFARAPALRQLQGDTLAQDARLAIGVYLAGLATGAMGRVRLQRK